MALINELEKQGNFLFSDIEVSSLFYFSFLAIPFSLLDGAGVTK